jgi:hypothetical protein
MCYTSRMKIKDILINSDKLRFFVFPNVLILYVYLQIIFLFIYLQISKTSLHLSQADIAIENMFDFGIVFMSVIISLFMICFCFIMTFVEYILRKKINFKIMNFKKYPNIFNKIHKLLFYFGLVIIFTYISFLFYRFIFT